MFWYYLCPGLFVLGRISQAACKAFDALKKMKTERNAGGRNERKRVKREMSSLLKPRTANNCLWRHKFFCWAYIDEEKSPTCEADKDESRSRREGNCI